MTTRRRCAYPECDGETHIAAVRCYNVDLCFNHYTRCYFSGEICAYGRCLYPRCGDRVVEPSLGRNPGLCPDHYRDNYACRYPFFPRCPKYRGKNDYCCEHAPFFGKKKMKSLLFYFDQFDVVVPVMAIFVLVVVISLGWLSSPK